MIINLYFDNKYFHWADPVVRSINLNEPGTKIHFHTFNLSDKQVKELESYSNMAHVENRVMLFDPEVSEPYSKCGVGIEDLLRFQITCRKGEFLLKSMDRFPDESMFIVMDVDMLLVHSLNDLRNQMKGHDIGIIRSGNEKICGGFITAMSTEKGKHFLTMFDKLVMKDRLYLCKDQKTLSRVYNETNTIVKFCLLSRRYLDHRFSKESYIWSAHKSKFGTKKETYQRYIKALDQMKEKKNAK